MKRLCAVMMALFMFVAASGSAFAATSATPQGTRLYGAPIYVEPRTEITPRGPVQVYDISIPADGRFHEVVGFRGTYTAGSEVEITGTWYPVYASITVEVEDIVNGGGMGGYLSESGDSMTLNMPTTSTWSLSVWADEFDVDGTLEVTVYN